jgi:hypothetical protein
MSEGDFERALNKQAKRLSDLFWENDLEWNKWLMMGATEKKSMELAPKYDEQCQRMEVIV